MKKDSLYNFVYIVRVWRESDSGTAPWRFAVEETVTGKRHGFCELADVAGYIETELEATGDRKTRPDSGGRRDNRDDAVKEEKTLPTKMII